MTITLTETDIAAYRARVDRYQGAVREWVFKHATQIQSEMSRSDSDAHAARNVRDYMISHSFPQLALFDL